jgi:hypothetical protein
MCVICNFFLCFTSNKGIDFYTWIPPSIHVKSYILNAFQFKILICSFNSLQIQSLHGYPPPFMWSHTFWMHSNVRTLFVVLVVYNFNHFIYTHLHVHMDSYKSALSVGTIFICLFAQIFIKWSWRFNDKRCVFILPNDWKAYMCLYRFNKHASYIKIVGPVHVIGVNWTLMILVVKYADIIHLCYHFCDVTIQGFQNNISNICIWS